MLGVPYDPTPARDRDWQEVEDYELIIRLLLERQAREHERLQRSRQYGK